LENDNLLEGVFYVVVSLGLVLFGTVILWTISSLVVLVIGPSKVDEWMIIVLALMELMVFIVALGYFILGIQKGSEAISKMNEKKNENHPDINDNSNMQRNPSWPDTLMIRCKKCKGTGDCKLCKIEGLCNECGGEGKVKNSYDQFVTCEKCQGTGDCQNCQGNKTCLTCGGAGKISPEKRKRKRK